MISIRNLLIVGTLGSGCNVGLGIVDKSVDTAGGPLLDSANEVDTGVPVDTDDTDDIEDTDTQDTSDTNDTSDTSDTQNTSDFDQDGYSTEEGDCDDYNPSISPIAVDDCDGVDNNCDGTID